MVKKHYMNTFKLFCIYVNEKFKGKHPCEIFDDASMTSTFGEHYRFEDCVFVLHGVYVFCLKFGDIHYQRYKDPIETVYIDTEKFLKDIV